MSVIKSRCPVPPEQLPINQYEGVRDSWFYGWGSRGLKAFLNPVIILCSLVWIFTGPIIVASHGPGSCALPVGFLAAAGAQMLPGLALAQWYVGWLHVGQRLQQAAVFYEESGWYDGQMWQKPEEILNRDRLIMDYQVKPVLQRVRNTLGCLLALGVALITAWQFL